MSPYNCLVGTDSERDDSEGSMEIQLLTGHFCIRGSMSLGIDSEPTSRRMVVFNSKPDTRVMSASLKAIRFWPLKQLCCEHVRKTRRIVHQNQPRNPGNATTRGNRGKTHTHDANTHHHDSRTMQEHKPTFRLEDINTFTVLRTARSVNQQCSRALSALKEHHCSAV